MSISFVTRAWQKPNYYFELRPMFYAVFQISECRFVSEKPKPIECDSFWTVNYFFQFMESHISATNPPEAQERSII
jgi:hypothetical protein